ncbi:Cupredoxin [Lepidopterella palustris CBS 459.81]|uniref:Cupredoxin n=1 Tax=Lepidopterella palustris CBS 459.81 TaxID=1314670 RepID=A0A8E2JG74_9PEZI|nr:Cupredoxin [Lepidopterella palustris CBS 459.81]
MLFQSILASSSLLGLALAATHNVMVGMSGLTFMPNNTAAAAGDMVTFHFYPAKHSVVQATFAAPCEPSAGGFYSGFVPTSSGESMTTFTIMVNDTKPIWFYCSQGTHCQSGMVGAINAATTGNTVEGFAAAAAKATNNTTPQVADGMGGTLSMSNMTSTASATKSMSMSMTGTATGMMTSMTGSSAASPKNIGTGLGYSAAFAFLGYLFV